MVDFELSTFKSLHPDASEPTGLLRNEEDEREREKTVISSLLSRVAGGRSNGKYFISARVELGWGGMKCMCICV